MEKEKNKRFQGSLESTAWVEFIRDFGLSDEKAMAYKQFSDLILSWNENINLTAEQAEGGIVRHLFRDSLYLSRFLDLSGPLTIADVGTGAGIPGLALKIFLPHLKLVLIEVTRKKRDFLRLAIEELGLEGVEISDLDWRTFNRKAYYEIDFFVTKAAFSDSEIVRMFRHGCNYREKPLVYWASSLWICEQKSQPFVRECFDYVNGKRECRLVVFSLPETSFLKKVNN